MFLVVTICLLALFLLPQLRWDLSRLLLVSLGRVHGRRGTCVISSLRVTDDVKLIHAKSFSWTRTRLDSCPEVPILFNAQRDDLLPVEVTHEAPHELDFMLATSSSTLMFTILKSFFLWWG